MWANDEDSAKRIALFHMASPVGSAASGYLVCTKVKQVLNLKIIDRIASSKQQYTTVSMVFMASLAGVGST